MPFYYPEYLLQVFQRLIKFPKPKQIEQIHSQLIVDGHLLPSSHTSPKFKWMNTLLYNALIRAYLMLGQPHKTILLFTFMIIHQVLPNNHTFPSVIKAACSSASLASLTGRSLHSQVFRRGVLSDPFVRTSFLGFYAQMGDLGHARNLFEEISEPCIVSYNAMVDAFGKNGDMGSAVLLFERLPVRDVVSWTSIINGYGRNRCFEKAICFFEKMMRHADVRGGSVKPNEATFVSVLSSCANSDGVGALYQGKQIHGYMLKNEIELSVFMGTALIDLYGKMGCLGYALGVFHNMVTKAVCTWNAMICSFALNGREKEALDMFKEMKMGGWGPNEVTFVAVLSACAHSRLVELGLELFESMPIVFGVIPRMEHYGCVVDLLGRAGLLRDAYEFLMRMPFKPDETVLGALLGACRIHGAIELGNEVGRRLLELQPQHCGRYVLLSSINAGAEKWDHAAALRRAMVNAGIHKIPAFSMVDTV